MFPPGVVFVFTELIFKTFTEISDPWISFGPALSCIRWAIQASRLRGWLGHSEASTWRLPQGSCLLVQLLLGMLLLLHLGAPLGGNHLHTRLRTQSQTQDNYSKTCMPRSCEIRVP